MTTHRLTDAERDVLGERIPLQHLLPLAGQDRLTLDQVTHAATLELDLKRRAIARVKAGEFCVVTRQHPGRHLRLDMGAFWRRHGEEVACPT